MLITQIVGYCAAVSLMSTLLPQLYHTFKTKKVEDISYFFILLNLLTSTLFLIYGILLYELPIIIANVFLIIQNSTLFTFKKLYNLKQITEV